MGQNQSENPTSTTESPSNPFQAIIQHSQSIVNPLTQPPPPEPQKILLEPDKQPIPNPSPNPHPVIAKSDLNSQGTYGNVGWYCRPCRWNLEGRRWESVPVEFVEKIKKDEITVLSYNVWFDHSVNIVQRMDAIGKIIVKEKPDLIALQEMTPYICSLLFSQSWVLEYYVSDPLGKELGKPHDNWKYGNIILSRVNFRDVLLRDFPSNQSRKALCGSVYVNDILVTLGTFHLESYPSESLTRRKQLELFRNITNSSEHILLIGDSNMERDSENEVLYPKFKEAWLELYPGNKGYTFSTTSQYRRYDRVFYTPKTIKINTVYYVGKETIPGGSYPSDHLGVVTKFSLI